MHVTFMSPDPDELSNITCEMLSGCSFRLCGFTFFVPKHLFEIPKVAYVSLNDYGAV